jgi:cytosine/uracil/thiamine/allantoin permease
VAFLFGGTTAQYEGFRGGVLTMLAGNTIGVVILLLALVLPSSKWGTEFFVHQRSVYGPVGALAFVLACACSTASRRRACCCSAYG